MNRDRGDARDARKKTIKSETAGVTFETSEEVDVTPTFDSMGLREDLQRGIYAYGGCCDITRLNTNFYYKIN